MHATIRRYEAIDETRTSELVKKAEDSLLPRLSELPGFNGYYLIEAGNGVISSVGFFDSAEHAEESIRVASNWVREENFETALPNPAEDHERTGSCPQDARARRGVTAPKPLLSARRSASAGLLVTLGPHAARR